MQEQNRPLAVRMRPSVLDEFVGQEHIVGIGTPLRKAIDDDTVSSCVFSGAPGTGKTTLARVIAQATQAQFVQVNAVMSGVQELKKICQEAEVLQRSFQKKTILFIDEIHRFNKAQQDALLPFVENGAVILIGATTENPYFEVNAALVSRSTVYLLHPLSQEYLERILRHALASPKGYAGSVTVTDDALKHIAKRSNGDARIALNLLEIAVQTIGKSMTTEDVCRTFKERSFRYDRNGEEHYNTISAFIKSLRGSDPDASLLWLFTMLQSGETPRFLFRRMAIVASEDIGLADPRALHVVVSAWQAFEMVGMPEGEYFLAQACIYLAQAPKSNAVKRAMNAVQRTLRDAPSLEVPMHLRNAPVPGMKSQGYSNHYDDPHDAPDGVVKAHYFPSEMEACDFYRPSNRGFEAEVAERLEKAKAIIRKAL